jgi:hypothetical protein
MAKLPEYLIEKKLPTLAELQPGERALFPLYGFKIDAEHNLFASLSVELHTQGSKHDYGEIWRDEKGAYHADLKGTRRKWKPENLQLYLMSQKPGIVPIATIAGTESYDR